MTSDRTISILFMIGSACFAMGAVPGYAGAVGATMVWRPDAYGSACFLVASALALAVFGRSWYSWRSRKRPWWIAVANILPRSPAKRTLAVSGTPAAT